MGPKAKKTKKSKAELEEERLAREEEERKAKLAEDKRIAEENEKKRLEEQRIKAEHKSSREKELARLSIEHEENNDDLVSKKAQLQAEEKKENQLVEWARYHEPSDEPDASIESDMNTFITLTKETVVQDMKPTIALIKNIEKVARRVEDVWSECLANRNHIRGAQALCNLFELQKIIFDKIDVATVKILRFSDKHLNDRTEMNIEETAHELSVGMWASYSDVRPMRKSVQFETMGVQFDIQKQVLQQHDNYVFRVIRMPIVPYNFQAYDVSPETIAAAAATAAAAITPESPPASSNKHGHHHFGNHNSTTSGHTTYSAASSATIAANQIPPPTKYVVGDLIVFDILHTPQTAYQLRARKWTLRDNSLNSTRLRKASYPSSVPCRMVLKVPDNVVITDDLRIAVWNEDAKDWVEDGVSEYQYSENTRTVQFYITTVGILALVKKRVVDMPYKKWSMSPILSKQVNQLLATKFKFTGVSELVNVNNNNSAILSTDTISDVETFEQHVRITIQTQKHEVVIDIIGAKCKLIKPDTAIFTDLLGLLLLPGTLLCRLQRKGINLLPTQADLQAADNCNPKDAGMENSVVTELARASSSMEFASSIWNQHLNESQIGILVKESTVYTSFTEAFDFECVFVEMDAVSESYLNTPELGLVSGPGGLKFTLVQGNEYGNKKNFSSIPRPGEVPHLGLPRVLAGRTTKEAMERLDNINQRFQKTIYTLLSLIKPYSLC